MTAPSHVAIVGSGAFGTALAIVADRAGRKVTLLARDGGEASAIAAARENVRRLPGVKLAASVAVSGDPMSLRSAGIVLLALPAQATRDAVNRLAGAIPKGIPVVATAKGLERRSGKTQTELIAELLPGRVPAALSGPGFAEEIANGLPTAVTVAAADLRTAHMLAAALATDAFRPYASDDLIGVELGGAIKNVLAIASGVVAGRGLGESARASLIARGLAEMTRLGVALGARAETFMGLSGLGDLVLTATSLSSRNLRFGMALGEGRSVAELLGPGEPLVEGAYTAAVAADLARSHGVDMPITRAVAAIVAGRLSVDAAVEGLVTRPLKAEAE